MSIISSTTGRALNNSSRTSCINDFGLRRIEAILDLCMQTMEYAFVEVKRIFNLPFFLRLLEIGGSSSSQVSLSHFFL